MDTQPDPILLDDPGQPLPADAAPGAPIYLRVDTFAPALDDGCLGQHYPDANPACTAR